MPIERILFTLDGMRRYWFLFVLPLVIAAPIALLAWKLSPMRYEAKSTVLMISANRAPEGAAGGAGFPRHYAVEQVAVLEAWLKSDHVLMQLLPQLLDEEVPTDATAVSALVNALRRSLTLQVIGAGAMEIQLQGAEAKGLGRKLEIIVTRLMEGVLNPEAGILSAPHLIIARRRDAMVEADAALSRAIVAAGLGSPDQVKARLLALSALKREHQADPTARMRAASVESDRGATTGSSSAQPRPNSVSPALEVEGARTAISPDVEVVKTLERMFEIYQEANFAYREASEAAGAPATSYVRVFDAPERLTVIGRPQDPVIGISSGRKYAAAVLLLGGLTSLALMGLAILWDTRLRVKEDFEQIAEVPVVARLAKVSAGS